MSFEPNTTQQWVDPTHVHVSAILVSMLKCLPRCTPIFRLHEICHCILIHEGLSAVVDLFPIVELAFKWVTRLCRMFSPGISPDSAIV